MKLKEIHRTATFAWSPSESIPFLASGTVSGALDESFSNESQLEVWALDFLDGNEYDLGGVGQTGPKGSITTSSRFNRVAWGYPNASRERGIIAAGMENGELGLWDPEKILVNAGTAESLILRNTTHQGSVRGLDFNPIQTNLLSSGAVNGEIYIWDLKDPTKPYSPGSRSSKLDDITSLAWNRQVQYVLASASSTGYTVVWDLRGRREVIALAYGAGNAGGAVGLGGARGGGIGGGRGVSDVAWHPDNATRLVTSSEDDNSPVVMVWDLRNARAPEKILTGHEKGVLSVSWCAQDADLLLSCGKDNRTLCWNPQTSEIIGELPSADNWAFQVEWCPRNPDLLATAYFDGTIGIHGLQSTNNAVDTAAAAAAPAPRADGSDVFDVPGFSRTTQATLSLKQPPKWLRRPTSASFGYGGQLVTVSNLPSAQGGNQSSSVHIYKIISELDVVERARELQIAEEGGEEKLTALAEDKSTASNTDPEQDAAWKALASLFKTDSRDELVTLLGFSKAEVAARVADAIENLKITTAPSVSVDSSATIEDATPESVRRGPVVSFAEPESDTEKERSPELVDLDQFGGESAEPTPSERSASATSASEAAGVVGADGESTTTAPSLFDEEAVGAGTPQVAAGADFFSTMGTIRNPAVDEVVVPHTNYAHDSSVAATIGSRPSSAASEVIKHNTFRIYPGDESDIDQLVTKALVLGDFESAVSLCLSSDRYADAILLAVKGGPGLLQRTQKAYFEKRTSALPYLRLFQSIVLDDLEDIVQNADLQEWQEIFVVICTFAKQDEFANLAEQLGQRLEFQSNLIRSADKEGSYDLKKHATLTYLAAGRLEKLINIWIEEMAEEERKFIDQSANAENSRYSAHAHALQSLMEKVTVFRSAVKYQDPELQTTGIIQEASVRTYKLSPLYDRYFEYADFLAAQGLLSEAVKYLNLTPYDYPGTRGSGLDFTLARERLVKASGSVAGPSKARPSIPSVSTSITAITQPTYPYSVQPEVPPPVPPVAAYNPYNSVPAAADYTPTRSIAPGQPQYQSTVPMQAHNGGAYAPNTYNPPPAPVQVPAPHAFNASSQPTGAVLPPPPRKKDEGHWNDAPPVAERRTPHLNNNKPAAIISPFLNAGGPQRVGSPAFVPGQPPQNLPPPPRPGSTQAQGPLPPGPPRPPTGHAPYPPPPGPGSTFSPTQGPSQPLPPPQGRFPPQHQAGHFQPPPPGRALSPPQSQPIPGPPMRQAGPPTHGHFSPQQQQANQGAPFAHGTAPPPGAPLRGPPQQLIGHGVARGSSPLVPHQQQPQQPPSGPYAPPPGAARQMPPGALGGPPTQHVQHPPPGAARGGPQGPPPGGPGAPRPPPAAKGPPPPKYPPGDRSHIPEASKRAYNIFSQELMRLRQITPPQQKRMADDTERRVNVLFDALNCETLSQPVLDQLKELSEAIATHDKQRAQAIHVDLLTRGSRTDDIGLWMSGVKQLIMVL